MKRGDHIKWREGPNVYTLWIERVYEDGSVLGWCPEKRNNWCVAATNILEEVEAS